MKKLLGILGAIAIIPATAVGVVSCTNKTEESKGYDLALTQLTDITVKAIFNVKLTEVDVFAIRHDIEENVNAQLTTQFGKVELYKDYKIDTSAIKVDANISEDVEVIVIGLKHSTVFKENSQTKVKIISQSTEGDLVKLCAGLSYHFGVRNTKELSEFERDGIAYWVVNGINQFFDNVFNHEATESGDYMIDPSFLEVGADVTDGINIIVKATMYPKIITRGTEALIPVTFSNWN